MKFFDYFEGALKSWDFIDETGVSRVVPSLIIFGQIGKTGWASCLCGTRNSDYLRYDHQYCWQ